MTSQRLRPLGWPFRPTGLDPGDQDETRFAYRVPGAVKGWERLARSIDASRSPSPKQALVYLLRKWRQGASQEQATAGYSRYFPSLFLNRDQGGQDRQNTIRRNAPKGYKQSYVLCLVWKSRSARYSIYHAINFSTWSHLATRRSRLHFSQLGRVGPLQTIICLVVSRNSRWQESGERETWGPRSH